MNRREFSAALAGAAASAALAPRAQAAAAEAPAISQRGKTLYRRALILASKVAPPEPQAGRMRYSSIEIASVFAFADSRAEP